MRISFMLVGIVTILVSGFGMNMSMRNDQNGGMKDCSFMNHSSSICQMSSSEHMAKWQSLFTANTQAEEALFIAFLAAVFLYVFFQRRENLTSDQFLYRYYLHKNDNNKLFNDLLVAFSKGVLQPKLYV